ncbi:hypothetical protein E5161_12520 [Cohnella pontilimi]|uniref:Uncharacterized protein n=1 Tax=Cohnella pontilimi TaxID=2564100 RepID=A0A4V5LS79_9BACL|nr:hypothetical protein [Cohnella pontilimi]TJY42009.1 hypothetical protein E5161_12520 [Cohnella pontilimi]
MFKVTKWVQLSVFTCALAVGLFWAGEVSYAVGDVEGVVPRDSVVQADVVTLVDVPAPEMDYRVLDAEVHAKIEAEAEAAKVNSDIQGNDELSVDAAVEADSILD